MSTGKQLPATLTEVRLVFKHPPRLGFGLEKDRKSAPSQFIVKLDPSQLPDQIRLEASEGAFLVE